MENNRAEERSPILVAAGIAAIIIVILVVLGLFVRQNIPSEAGTPVNAPSADASTEEVTDEAAPAADAASADESTAADDSPEAAQADAADANADAAAADDGAADASADAEDAAETTADAAANDAEAASDEPAAPDDLAVAFATGGCSGCHTIPDIQAAVGQIGPNLAGIGAAAATRIEGLPAEEYIRQSMLDPEAFIAPECPTGPCPTGLMLPHYASALSEDQFNSIVNYLLSLTDESAVAAASDEEAAAPIAEEAAPAEEAPAAEAAPEAAEPAPEEAVADADAGADAPAEAAPVDMAQVSAVVTKGTCGACHVIPGVDIAVGMIGPDLSNIGAEAGTRVEGLSAEEYLHQSIMEPNAVIAPKCPTGDCLPGIMLPNLAELLTPEEIDTIVGYLLTLQGP